MPCDYITVISSCQVLFSIFFEIFFQTLKSVRFSRSLFFSAQLSYHNCLLLSRTFFNFFALFSEDTFSRCRSLECLHILPYHFTIVNCFFKLFRHFLQRSLVFLVRYAIYYVCKHSYTLYICLKPFLILKNFSEYCV